MTKPISNGIPMVDGWTPDKDDIFFSSAKDVVAAPIADYYKMNDTSDPMTTRINFFWIKPKKSYNSDGLREHCCHYLNYFEKFFDEEKEYFTNMALIKFLMDCYVD